MSLSNTKIPLRDILLARITDELAFISWSKTKDGAKNRNKPKPVLKVLMEKDKEEVQAFRTPEEFMNAWNDIVSRSKDG